MAVSEGNGCLRVTGEMQPAPGVWVLLAAHRFYLQIHREAGEGSYRINKPNVANAAADDCAGGRDAGFYGAPLGTGTSPRGSRRPSPARGR